MVVSRARIIHGIDNSVHILLARLGRAKYKVGGMAVKRNSGLRTHSRKHQLQCLLGISRGTISSRASASLSPLFARTRRPTRARIGGKNRLVKMRATTCNRRVEEWSIDYWLFFFLFCFWRRVNGESVTRVYGLSAILWLIGILLRRNRKSTAAFSKI